MYENNDDISVEFAGLILAAGKGVRLRPLTETLPKPLLKVGTSTLLDRAIDSLPIPLQAIAVNASYLAPQIIDYLESTPIYVSVESEPLGSAGAVGAVKDWVAGRALMVRNADMWFEYQPTDLWLDWNGEHPRVLVKEVGRPSDFGSKQFLGWSLLPARDVLRLQPVRSGLLDLVWGPALDQGRLEFVEYSGVAIDCGTVDDLARARTLTR